MRYLLWLLCACYLVPANAQIGTLEYYFDTDPGYGRGQILGVPAGSDITQSFNLPLASLTPGYHSAGIRAGDGRGHWSQTVFHTFFLATAPAGTLSGYEYYIDTDPGNGRGTTINAAPGSDGYTRYLIPLTTYGRGFHTLGIRSRDDRGQWSATLQRVFFAAASNSTPNIVRILYYYTGDGATGDSYTYTVPVPAPDVDLDFSSDLSRLTPDREYTLHMIAVNSDGLQSQEYLRKVKVCSVDPVRAGFDGVVTGHQLHFIDSSRGRGTYHWSFGDGQIDSVSNPVHTYTAVGSYTIRQIKGNICNADTLSRIYTIKGISDVYPVRGGNSGFLTMTFHGAGFDANTKFILHGAAGDLSPDTVWTIDGSTAQASFDLTNKTTGLYDIKAEYGAGGAGTTSSASLPQGFTILTDTKGPQLAVDFTGRDVIRTGIPQDYQLTITNTGLVDARNVPVYLVIQGDSNVGISVNATWVKPDNTGIYDGVPVFHKPDSLYGQPFNGVVLPVQVGNVPAGGQESYKVTLTDPSDKNLDLKLWAGQPFLKGNELEECFQSVTSIALQALGKITKSPCAAEATDNFYEYYRAIYAPDMPFVKRLGAMIWPVFKTAVNCTEIELEIDNKLGKFVWLELLTAARLEGPVTNPLTALGACGKIYISSDGTILKKLIKRVTSLDPNEKTGPAGNSMENFNKGKVAFNYRIYFENQPGTTAPAQTVTIIDTLDKTKFDLSTFALQDYGFGDSTDLYMPVGRTSYARTIDLRRTGRPALQVRYDVTLDTATGIIKWRFLSLDPQTRELPADPLDGFLPPDRDGKEGRGYVSYSVNPLKELADGTEIKNKASIRFDNNTPIITNEFLNTIDKTGPVSRVNALPAYSPDSNITIHWNGSDSRSGVGGYDIYCSVNNGPFFQWLYDVKDTSAVFPGHPDSTYRFYSMARDFAGNNETSKSSAETQTQVKNPVTAVTNIPTNEMGILRVLPNPTRSVSTIEVWLPVPQELTLEIYEASGRLLKQVDAGTVGQGIQQLPLDMSGYAPGIYLLRIRTPKFQGTIKIEKI